MFNLKNIYSKLYSVEINSLFCKDSFIVQDSLNFISSSNLKQKNDSIKLLTKFTIKTILFCNYFVLKNLKFPLYIASIEAFFKSENPFSSLFTNFSNTLFLKYKNYVFNFEFKQNPTFFDFLPKLETFKFFKNIFFNLIIIDSFIFFDIELKASYSMICV